MTTLIVTLKIYLNEELMKEKGITADVIARGMRLYQDDVVDGFQLTTSITGIDSTEFYFLQDGKIESSVPC